MQAECVFATKRVVSSFDRFCHTVASLPHESMRLIRDIVKNPPADGQCEAVKARLMQTHELTAFQRVEKIIDMPGLGSRKPSQLLAAMLELCPENEARTTFFSCIFLKKLPRELKILLSETDTGDLQALASKADALHAHAEPMSSVSAVTEHEDDSAVAAVRSGSSARPPGGQGGARRERKKNGGGGRSKQESLEPELSRSARMAAGLCLSHWRYGSEARYCSQPCKWAGNAPAGGN